MTEVIEVALCFAEALESCGLRYVIGGSLASALCGEPRSTLDIDMVVDVSDAAVAPLLSRLGSEFYLDADALRQAIRSRSCVNAIHEATTVKVDIFVAGTTLQRLQLNRRQRIIVASDPERSLFFYTPEDILTQKLLWFRQGGEVSDRQWRDVTGIALAQGAALDWIYLEAQAAAAGVADLLGRLRRETSD